MLNVILFGPPGAGKGTQSAKLIEKYKLVHLSTGDIFRAHIKEKTELGKLAKSYSDSGNLVPDEVTIKMLEGELDKNPDARGFIFDGFPRTPAQAKALDTFLEERGTTIHQMIALQVPEEELVKRLLLRGEESGRPDDKDESIVRNRIKVYNEQTAVVADHYSRQHKYVPVEGVGEIKGIFDRLSYVIDSLSSRS